MEVYCHHHQHSQSQVRHRQEVATLKTDRTKEIECWNNSSEKQKKR